MKLAGLLLLSLTLGGCAVLTGAAGSIAGSILLSLGEGVASEIGSKAVGATDLDAYFKNMAVNYAPKEAQ